MTQPDQLTAVLGPVQALETPTPSTGDLEAFIREHHPRLLRLARIICHDAGDAADAVQMAFVRAWSDQGSLRDPARMRPWLDRIVVREAIRINRRPRLVHRLGAGRRSSSGQPEPDAIDPQTGLMVDWSAFRIAFELLPPEQRAALALHLDAGYSVAETAAIMGTPHETVRSRIRLAKERLRRELGGLG